MAPCEMTHYYDKANLPWDYSISSAYSIYTVLIIGQSVQKEGLVYLKFYLARKRTILGMHG